MLRAASVTVGHLRQSGHGVGDDGQERIEEQRDEGRGRADAAYAKARRQWKLRGEPAERRDQYAEQRHGRDGLHDVEAVEDQRPEARQAMAEKAERNAGHGRRDERAERQGDMALRFIPETVGAAAIFLHEGNIVPEAGGQQEGEKQRRRDQQGKAQQRADFEAHQAVGHI